EDDCDWFLHEVMDKGKVLYEAPHRAVGSQGRGRHRVSKNTGHARKPKRDAACFHCQQAAEKYLKALLKELGLVVPRTHELNKLLNLLRPHDGTLATLRRGVRSLTIRSRFSLSRGPCHVAADARSATPGRARANRIACPARSADVSQSIVVHDRAEPAALGEQRIAA